MRAQASYGALVEITEAKEKSQNVASSKGISRSFDDATYSKSVSRRSDRRVFQVRNGSRNLIGCSPEVDRDDLSTVLRH